MPSKEGWRGPVSETGVAFNVTESKATLEGQIYSEKHEFAEFAYFFEYGTSTSYGSSTPAPPGSTIGPVASCGLPCEGSESIPKRASVNLTGLEPGTTYHYRLVSTNVEDGYRSFGEDATFTTGGEKPSPSSGGGETPPGGDGQSGTSSAQSGWGAPDGPLELSAGFHAVTGEATSVTATGATLNGYVDPEGKETTYYFEYGQTTSYGRSVPIPHGSVGSGVVWKAVSQSVAGLERDSTYHYRLVATNSSGTTYGQDHTIATIPWTIQNIPKPVETTNKTYAGGLAGISCSASIACIGVGWYDTSSEVRVILAERWNGTEWSVQATPNPAGAKESELLGVSCASSSACEGVGDDRSSGTRVTLGERWNGTEWTIQSTPSPEGAKGSELLGVSCTSSNACTAVGRYYTKDNAKTLEPEYLTLAERWNGEKWSIQSTSNPEGATKSALEGVSCTSTEGCTAVGSDINSAKKTVGLVERWNGKEWSDQEISTASGLDSVSCTSSEACTAVGGKLTAERWNGKEWSVQSLPNPVGAHESDLYNGSSAVRGVSCSSSTSVSPIGSLEREAEVTTMAEIWDAAEWLVQGASRPPEGVLYGVSCPSGAACTAVGSYLGTVLEEHDHTEPLAEYATLPPTPSVETRAATSVTKTEATLNGTVNPRGLETKYDFEYGETTSYGTKTAEVSAGSGANGVEVSKVITGLTAGKQYDFRIVATNSSKETSYGSNQVFTTTAPAWSLQTTPNPTGSTFSILNGDSCTSSTECTAVGFYKGSSGVVTLAERWNGSEWSIQSTPNPSGSKESELLSVSCLSSTFYTAVGTYEVSSVDENAPLVEHWNGTEWSMQTAPNYSGTLRSVLDGVSCTSSTACIAVGYYLQGSSPYDYETLAERWNGTEWSLQTTPNPAGRTGENNYLTLSGISCTASNACTAVGWYATKGGESGQATLAERWNGTEWALQTMPSPSGAKESSAAGLACPLSSTCFATGSYLNSSGTYMTLGEEYH